MVKPPFDNAFSNSMSSFQNAGVYPSYSQFLCVQQKDITAKFKLPNAERIRGIRVSSAGNAPSSVEFVKFVSVIRNRIRRTYKKIIISETTVGS